MPRITAALLAVASVATSAAAASSDPQLAALYAGPVNPQSVCNSGLKPTGWKQTFSLSPAKGGSGLGLSYSATSDVAFAQGDIIVAGGSGQKAYKCNQISVARNMDLALVGQNETSKYKQCRSQSGMYAGKFDPSLLCGLCRSTDSQSATPAPQCPIVVVGDSEVRGFVGSFFSHFLLPPLSLSLSLSSIILSVSIFKSSFGDVTKLMISTALISISQSPISRR